MYLPTKIDKYREERMRDKSWAHDSGEIYLHKKVNAVPSRKDQNVRLKRSYHRQEGVRLEGKGIWMLEVSHYLIKKNIRLGQNKLH